MQRVAVTQFNYVIALKEEMYIYEDGFASYNYIDKIYLCDKEDLDLAEPKMHIAQIIRQNNEYKELRNGRRK